MLYYVSASNQQEKITQEQLPKLIAQGLIRPSTLVWTQGMADWQPAGTAMPDLFENNPGSSIPPISPAGIGRGDRHRTDDIDYEIFGDDMQVVEVKLWCYSGDFHWEGSPSTLPPPGMTTPIS